jgi:GNAT superfamily N-acetyltransferase
VSWTLTGSVAEYLDAAGDFLRADPVRHTVELTVTAELAAGPAVPGAEPPVFGWWRPDGGAVTAAAFQTPPFPLLLSPGPAGPGRDAALRALAAEMADRKRRLEGVTGPVADASFFAARWRELTGDGAAVKMRTRLHHLGDLAWPDPMPPGRARLATEADFGTAAAWLTAFAVEAGLPDSETGAVSSGAVTELGEGRLTLWEVDGRPVSLAGNHHPAAGVVRVGPVFTPPADRGRGYGGAVTAAVSQAALDAGAQAVLFTDLANSTSNALYARLGYRPVADRVVLGFGPATCS